MGAQGEPDALVGCELPFRAISKQLTVVAHSSRASCSPEPPPSSTSPD